MNKILIHSERATGIGTKFFLGLTICFLIGCGEKSNSSQKPSAENNASPAPKASSENEQDSKKTNEETESNASEPLQEIEKEGIKAKISNWETVQHFIGEQKGKVVILDIWSTWCFPCMREYPGLVALQKRYPEKVVCISFNVNYDGSEKYPPESNADEIMEFLVKEQSKLHNFISSTPDEQLYETIKLASIPVVYVYNTDGSLKKRFDNEKNEYGNEGFNYESHVTPLVEDLLK